MDEHEKLMRAKQRVEAITGFYIHVAVFLMVMAGLTLLDYRSGASWWVQWPAMGWGLGVLLHAVLAFGRMPQFVRNWQLRKIHQIKNSM